MAEEEARVAAEGTALVSSAAPRPTGDLCAMQFLHKAHAT